MIGKALAFGILAQSATPGPAPSPSATPSPSPTPAFVQFVPTEKSVGYVLFFLLSPFIAPCITVGLGGWLIQRSFVSRANASAFADGLVKRMDEVLADSLEYWNSSPQEASFQKRDKLLSQKIKGSLKTLNSDLRYFQAKYARKEDLEEVMGSIFDTVTGGEFESAGRAPDTARYLMAVNALNGLKSRVLRVKL